MVLTCIDEEKKGDYAWNDWNLIDRLVMATRIRKLLSTASYQSCMPGSLSLPGCLVGQATRPEEEIASTPSSIFLFSEKSDPDRNHAILACMVFVAHRNLVTL
jgi:hypothetical protein